MSTSSGSSAASSSASDEHDPEAFERDDQRLQALALGAGIHPKHVQRALDHYAATLKKHVDAGDVDVDQLTDAHHAENLRRVVAENPSIHVHAKEPAPVGPHEDHESFAPGKTNEKTVRARLKAKGISYR